MDAPFSRLLEEVEREAREGELRGATVVVQSGQTAFASLHCHVRQYLGPLEFQQAIDSADLLICHAGAGVLIQGLMARKAIVAVPRLSALGEHLDDHQTELADALAKQRRIVVADARGLGEAIRAARKLCPAAPPSRDSALCRAVAASLREFC